MQEKLKQLDTGGFTQKPCCSPYCAASLRQFARNASKSSSYSVQRQENVSSSG